MTTTAHTDSQFVRWFRNSAPYINASRGRVLVLAFGGELLESRERFAGLVHDIALLDSLGVQLVLAFGCRPQIEQRLRERGAAIEYRDGLRVTDDAALACVKEAAGVVRVEIEALLSMGLAHSPMAGAAIRVVSGNFVTARPLGIRDGVDYCHTGEVRRVDTGAMRHQLNGGSIVLVPPLGYSPTGEAFNLSHEEVAASVARELGAEKLVCLVEGAGILSADGALLHELTLFEAAEQAMQLPLESELRRTLDAAVQACRGGVRRAHLLDRDHDGALLLELFTRDGVGTLITADAFEGTRRATIDDVGGILELIAPLEAQGVLVRRSRERLEMEIDRFVVVERDGMVIACAALYPMVDEPIGELACLAVHPDYRDHGRGDALLADIERRARGQGLVRLFVLTTRTAHWFLERGFEQAGIDALPVERQQLYNWQRRSRVFIKRL